MVWRDLDFGVDAPGLEVADAFEAMLPLLATPATSEISYRNELAAAPHERRIYFVVCIDGWKLDVSIWTDGLPPTVEEWTQSLPSRLTAETRLAILRLKEAWHRLPAYPYTVGGYEICVAVLEHGVRTLDGLDAYLARRGLPTRADSESAA